LLLNRKIRRARKNDFPLTNRFWNRAIGICTSYGSYFYGSIYEREILTRINTVIANTNWMKLMLVIHRRLPCISKGSSGLSAVEECWRKGKDELLESRYYSKFRNLKKTIAEYYRTKRFRLDMTNYLMRKLSEVIKQSKTWIHNKTGTTRAQLFLLLLCHQ